MRRFKFHAPLLAEGLLTYRIEDCIYEITAFIQPGAQSSG